MADKIEQTIYRLSLDGSAYIAGADKLSASTTKLSEAQEKANAKLAELQKSQNTFKKSLEETTAVIKANEKETLELTKQLNALKDSEKGTTIEAERLKTALRGIATNTKEFKIEAAELKNNLTNTTNQLKLHTKEVQAAEKASGGFTQGLTKAYTGLSRIAALIPGLGIGSLVAIIAGPVINAFSKWYDSVTKTADALKFLEDSFKGGQSGFIKASENVNELRLNVELAKQGFIDKEKVVEQYNTTMGKTAGTVKTLDEVEQKLVEHGDAYIQMMLLKAAANFALGEAAKKAFEAEEIRRKKETEFANAVIDTRIAGGSSLGLGGGAFNAREFDAETKRIADAQKKRKDAAVKIADDGSKTFADIAKKFQEDAAKIAKEHKFNFFEDTKDAKPKVEKSRKEVTNIYEQELQKLRADIAKLDEKGFTTEATITTAVEEDFKKRTIAFDKAFKNKQLTAGQLTSLKTYLSDLQKLTLDQNLKSFREQKAAYLAQIQNELDNLQIEESTKRLSTIQDRFERERQMIIAESEKLKNAAVLAEKTKIENIERLAPTKGGLTPAIQAKIQEIKDTYAKLFDDIEVIKNQKLQQLSFDTFEKLSEEARRLLDSGNLGVSQGSLTNIQKQTELFLQGKISYEKYQKELTEIARFEGQERFRLEKLFLEQEIRVRQAKLQTDKDLTADQIKRLEDEIRRLEQQLTDAEKGNALSTGSQQQAGKNSKIDTIVKYTQALGTLTQSVISFWQQVNAAESESLDRSIAIQQKRVDAAQRVAERGNAQYLKMEEDRLTELNVKKENAARKQLGINAALQGSEILVALISGLAQGAKIGGGLGAIASVAAIVAAIAGAFAIAQSLKPPQPSFFVGTKDTGQGGNVDGKGGFAATLHPNEAVLPAEKNKAYKPTVAAIYDGTIPAESLNAFVNNYHQIKSVPLPNYQRIKEAAELSIGSDGKMSVLLSEQNKKMDENTEVQKQVLRALKTIGVNVNMDKNGFAMSIMEVADQIKINSRV